MVVYPVPADGVGDAVEAGIEMSVSGLGSVRRTLDAWAAVPDRLPNRALSLHVEVDTGMGRGGLSTDEVADGMRMIDAAAGTRIVGIWSHLADGRDVGLSREQTRRFESG